MFIVEEVRWYLIPTLLFAGGLFVSFIVKYFSREVGGHGSDVVIAAYHSGQKIPIKVALLKIVTSAITLGGGGNAGKEGPMTQIAGSVPLSWLKKWDLVKGIEELLSLQVLGLALKQFSRFPLGEPY